MIFYLLASLLFSDVTAHRALSNTVLFGYQGWFDTPAGRGWVHWSPGVTPAADMVTFDLFPDVSDFPVESLYPTNLFDENNMSMSLYASSMVVDEYFRWMSQYGIDGIVLQRFLSELSDPSLLEARNQMFENVLTAAEKYNKAVMLMYDISGADANMWVSQLLSDFASLSFTSSAYIYHNDKPALGIWGIGFSDHVATPESAMQLLQELSPVAAIIGGVPTYWRTGDGDSAAGFEDVYASMDVLSPWLVGRFDSASSFASLFASTIAPDAALTSSRNQGYAPVMWPGFSWHNLQHQYGSEAPLDQIPRNGGDFWRMQYEALSTIPSLFLYGAMFDEFDESTAIAKAASTLNDIPNDGSFLYLSINGENIASDFYLQLAGEFTSDYHNRNSTNNSILLDNVPAPDACETCKNKAKEFAARQTSAKIMRREKSLSSK